MTILEFPKSTTVVLEGSRRFQLGGAKALYKDAKNLQLTKGVFDRDANLG
jgi:hypothetical protein